MRLEADNTITLERKNCTWCRYSPEPGKMRAPIYVPCHKCNGTGKRGRGKCRNCSNEYYFSPTPPGHVTIYKDDVLETCTKCNGAYENSEAENLTDTLPVEIFQRIPWRVERRPSRHMTWMEQHIGAGLGSCVDYGRHKNMSDDELIEKERESWTKSTQAIKVVRKEDHRLADEIVIVTSDQGYSMIGVWND